MSGDKDQDQVVKPAVQPQGTEEQGRLMGQFLQSFFQYSENFKGKEKKKKNKRSAEVESDGGNGDDDDEDEEVEDEEVEEGKHPSELIELGLHRAKLDQLVKHTINTQRRIIYGVGQRKVVLGVYSVDFLAWLKQGAERFEGRYGFLKERYLACCQCSMLLGDAVLRVGDLAKNMDVPGPLGVTDTEKSYVRIALCELLALFLGRRMDSEEDVAMLFARFSCPIMDLTSMTKAQVLALGSESLACLWLRRGKKHRVERVENLPRYMSTGGKSAQPRSRRNHLLEAATHAGEITFKVNVRRGLNKLNTSTSRKGRNLRRMNLNEVVRL